MTMTTKMIFLDLEWSRENNGRKSEILEIGAVIKQDGDEERSFFTYVRPEKRVGNDTLSFLRISPASLGNAGTLEEGLEKLEGFADLYDCAVFWSMDAVDMLKAAYKDKPYKRIKAVCMQELMTGLMNGKRLSFERALDAFLVPHDKRRLHNAGYDSLCLKALFETVTKQIKKSIGSASYIGSLSSNIVHKKGCRYERLISDRNGEEVSIEEALISKSFCKCCKPTLVADSEALSSSWYKKKDESNRALFLKGKKVSSSKADMLISFFRLKPLEKNSMYMVVSSEYSNWKIYMDGGFVTKLFHENYRCKNSYNGYHEHTLYKKDLYSVLEYISIHDLNINKKKKTTEREQELRRKTTKKKLQKERRRYKDDEEMY